MRAKARSALIATTMSEGSSMEGIHRCAVSGGESDMRAVAIGGGFAVKRGANEYFRAGRQTVSDAAFIREKHRQAQRAGNCFPERFGPSPVIRAERDVTEHLAHPPLQLTDPA